MTWCVYDKDNMSALRIKNTSESDSRSYEVTFKQLHFPGIIYLQRTRMIFIMYTSVHHMFSSKI